MSTPTRDLAEFDRGWLQVIQGTPWITVLYALVGLTRLGQRPVPLRRLAAVVDRPEEQTATLAHREFHTRLDGGLIHWDHPYPGDQPRRTVHIGDHTVRMGSGCGPDVFGFAAVLDVPFQVQETCPTTGTPIRIDFVPDGYQRVDPPAAVTILLPVDTIGPAADHGFDAVNANVCADQPFFASAAAAQAALTARPGSHLFTVADMFHRPWYTHLRDTLRPRIHTTNP